MGRYALYRYEQEKCKTVAQVYAELVRVNHNIAQARDFMMEIPHMAETEGDGPAVVWTDDNSYVVLDRQEREQVLLMLKEMMKERLERMNFFRLDLEWTLKERDRDKYEEYREIYSK